MWYNTGIFNFNEEVWMYAQNTCHWFQTKKLLLFWWFENWILNQSTFYVLINIIVITITHCLLSISFAYLLFLRISNILSFELYNFNVFKLFQYVYKSQLKYWFGIQIFVIQLWAFIWFFPMKNTQTFKVIELHSHVDLFCYANWKRKILIQQIYRVYA